MEEIWTEKYRPERLKDMTGQRHIVERLEAFVTKKSLPHCLFAGPAGCGKTTAALCIAHELYGSSWHGNFLELNASDERGIDTIREKVKDFARTIPLGGLFKIIYLDEADSLTRDAQHALRRMMEKYSGTARFILACNYSSKVIPPIQSRCAVFRFSQLNEAEMTEFLEKVSKEENLSVDEAAYKAVVYASEGDMRKAINMLQTASMARGQVTEEIIYSVTSRADPLAVRKMIGHALEGNFKEARKTLLSLMFDHGLAGEDIIKEIHSQVFELDMPDIRKINLIEKVGEYEFRLTEGSNAQIQLEALLAQFGRKD
ncbi:MAG: replication factor C small subunit [Candidatus Aenigmarchaeota archaeon]|nr:replication factor C small subunit [Candidatus Aenigmarchaeota archaeon]